MSSGSIQSDPATGAYLMEDAMVSTDDDQQPALKAEVGSLSVRDREEVTMRNTRLMAGKTPFYTSLSCEPRREKAAALISLLQAIDRATGSFSSMNTN